MSETPRSYRPRRPIVRPGFEPRNQPSIQANDGLLAIPPDALTPQHIRQVLSHDNVWTVALPLDSDTRYPGREGAPVMAAVLIALVMREEGVHVVLTERASHLHDHAGQISFPGGRIETTDASPQDAATREAYEETGLPPSHVEVLGTMPPYLTATGFSISPVVSLVKPDFEFVADAFEVAEIFEVPLAFLMDPSNHREHQVDLPDGRSRHYYSMTWERFFIWGATAGMLRNLYHLLRHAYTA